MKGNKINLLILNEDDFYRLKDIADIKGAPKGLPRNPG